MSFGTTYVEWPITVKSKFKGSFSDAVQQTLVFLDTDDHTLHQKPAYPSRAGTEKPKRPQEVTLKCRSEDRYLAEGMDPRIGKRFNGKRKFEEDIGAPFCQPIFSFGNHPIRSCKAAGNDIEGGPAVSRRAKRRKQRRKCDAATPLAVVNKLTVYERVLKGPSFTIPAGATTSVALILWSHSWKGRIIAAEFSSRYGNEKENYSAAGVATAFQFVFRCSGTRLVRSGRQDEDSNCLSRRLEKSSTHGNRIRIAKCLKGLHVLAPTIWLWIKVTSTLSRFVLSMGGPTGAAGGNMVSPTRP